MAINTDTITATGTTTPYDWTGGDGTAIVTGYIGGGSTELEYSLDDTNYAPTGGILTGEGGFNFTLPACKVRWNTKITSADATVLSAINFKASVENV